MPHYHKKICCCPKQHRCISGTTAPSAGLCGYTSCGRPWLSQRTVCGSWHGCCARCCARCCSASPRGHWPVCCADSYTREHSKASAGHILKYFAFYIFFSLSSGLTEKGEKADNRGLSCYSQGRGQEPGSPFCFPTCGGRTPNYLDHHLLPPVHTSRNPD